MRETPAILDALRRLGLDGTSGTSAIALSPEDATWLSGYFSGLAQALRARAGDAPRVSGSAAPERVSVLYGSETGNAASLAQLLGERLRARGVAAETSDLAGYKPRALERERTIAVITSTHGDGDPPESARSFFEALRGSTAPKALPNLRFAVLGLGDSSYEHFCKAAEILDERFASLGATRLIDRVDCDLDFHAPAARWMDDLTTRLAANAESATATATATAWVQSPDAGGATARASYDAAHPFAATVLENFALTGRGSSKETRHLALSLEGSGLRYVPGDALGICAPNDPAVVDALLRALGLRGDEPVDVAGSRLALRDALRGRLDVSVASPRFLRAWAEASRTEGLLALTTDTAAARSFLRAHHLLHIVEDYPAKGIAADVFAQWLRPLTPRLYSVASSLRAAPDEVQLTVGVVRYALNGRERSGVASGHVAERVHEGQTLPVYVHANASFRLPSDPRTPILMIGAGTGVAPYRAFIQERAASAARGPAWLFFGERNFRTDFLYQTEWQAALREQQLSRLTLAFSRDQAHKVYVQDRLREHAREVYAWLKDGAHVYVCGDAQALAPAVNEALLTILQEHAGSRERASEHLRALSEQGRYQRDVY